MLWLGYQYKVKKINLRRNNLPIMKGFVNRVDGHQMLQEHKVRPRKHCPKRSQSFLQISQLHPEPKVISVPIVCKIKCECSYIKSAFALVL